MPKTGRRRKKTRTHAQTTSEQSTGQSSLASTEKIPKSLIIRKTSNATGGTAELAELVHDFRKVMMPYTASNFQENPKLSLSTYSQQLALPMGVSHILAFSQNQDRVYLRICKTPDGPTLLLKVTKFSLCRHVVRLQRRPVDSSSLLQNAPPIVVCNNFGGGDSSPHLKLLRITFQNMFPATNVATVKLSDIRRVVLFDLQNSNVEDEESSSSGDSIVHMRHYAIRATPVVKDRKVKRLTNVVTSKKALPNLNKLEDIADYIVGNNHSAVVGVDGASDSEPEDGEASHVVLSSNYSKHNKKNTKSALKLVELGPRLSLHLIKVERGLASGDVMYHAHVQKTPEEIKELKERHEREATLKQKRRQEQEQNVERKRKEREQKREKKRRRKEEREQAVMEELRRGGVGSSRVEDNSDDEGQEEESGSEAEDEGARSSSSDEESEQSSDEE